MFGASLTVLMTETQNTCSVVERPDIRVLGTMIKNVVFFFNMGSPLKNFQWSSGLIGLRRWLSG